MKKPNPARLGLQLELDVKISGEWKELASTLTASVGEFFIKGPLDAASSAFSALIKFVSSLQMSASAGYRAWHLTVICFAWSVDQVFNNVDKKNLLKIIRMAVSESRTLAEKEGLLLPIDFIERPTNFYLFQNLRRFFLEEALVGYDDNFKEEILNKINSSFARSIFEVFSKRPDQFKPLVEALDVPGAASAEMSLAWTSYRSKLSYEFNVRPVFGQEDSRISLSQLYIPLRGFWVKEKTEIYDIYESMSPKENFNVVLLDEYLYDWSFQKDGSDWLRLIGGGPGSGKSTTLKSLASRISESESLRVLFIPLQYIDLEKDLRESINSFFVDSADSAFTQPPLSRLSIEDGPPLVLIFDGLDELVAPGEAAKEVVGTFANRLSNLVSAISTNGERLVKVIVSGRMPAFQSAAKYLTPPPHGALETCGFLPISPTSDEQSSIWQIDQRPIWWKQYAKLTGQSEAVPEAFSNEQLSGITHEPLLCYLLVLAGYATERWELAAENRNRIYEALVNSVYERGWGEGTAKRLGPGRTLSKPDFNKLMETIALAAWLGGDARVASEDKFIESIDITNAHDAWSSFCDDNGSDVTNLAMNFYFKASERSQRGFEFTHKSFGEYLSARALLYIAKEVGLQSIKKQDYAMQDWFKSTRTGHLSKEVFDFLRDEVSWVISEGGTDDVDEILDLKSQFQNIAKRVSVEGFPPSISQSNWRKLEIEQANSECSIWAVLNACANALYKYGYSDKCIVEIGWEDEDGLSEIILRLGRFESSAIIYQCLGYLNMEGQTLSGIYSHDVNFDGSILRNSLIASSNMFSGSFENADLEGCRFYESRIEKMNFSGAYVDGMIFHASKIKYSNFSNIRGGFIAVFPLTLISSSGNLTKDLGDRMRILSTADGAVERAIDAVLGGIEILRQTEDEYRDGLVEDIH